MLEKGIGALAIMLVGARGVTAQSCTDSGSVVFIGADVLTMADSVLLHGRDVVVRDGRIVAIEPTGVARTGCRIDAHGKVLLPGLADMHVHTDEREMSLFLANGITLVREMNGSPTHLALRKRIASGDVIGPRLLVASPLLASRCGFGIVSSPVTKQHTSPRTSSTKRATTS